MPDFAIGIPVFFFSEDFHSSTDTFAILKRKVRAFAVPPELYRSSTGLPALVEFLCVQSLECGPSGKLLEQDRLPEREQD